MVKKIVSAVLIFLFFLIDFSCSVNWFNDFNGLRDEEFSVVYNFYAEEESDSENAEYFSRRYKIGENLTSNDLPQPSEPEVVNLFLGKKLLGWKFYRFSDEKSSEKPESIQLDEKGFVSNVYVSSNSFDFVAEWGKIAKFTVEHFKQTEKDDEYESFDSEEIEGVAGEKTNAAAKNIEGFTAQKVEQQTILEDGSTLVEIKYDRNKYIVKFDKNGGSGSEIPEISAKYDIEFDLPENVFDAPSGYCAAQKAWNTEKDGSGLYYGANEKVKNLSVENNAVVTLYAQWKIDGHGNSGSASNPVENAKKIEIKLNPESSASISKLSYINISSLLLDSAVNLTDWKVSRSYLGIVSDECALLKSENAGDSYSGEEISSLYIYVDESWLTGEYVLNISAEYNGIGISKEITVEIE